MINSLTLFTIIFPHKVLENHVQYDVIPPGTIHVHSASEAHHLCTRLATNAFSVKHTRQEHL